MEHQERRAALSAFFWTISVMAIAGGMLFWKAEVIPTVPAPQNNDAALTEYASALDTANARLTEAGNRITTLQQQLNQRVAAAQAPSVEAPPASNVSSAQAIEYARKVAGALKPTADPELVELEGQTVWSIIYEPGTVYVSAADGTIVLVQRNQPAGTNNDHDNEQNESGNDD